MATLSTRKITPKQKVIPIGKFTAPRNIKPVANIAPVKKVVAPAKNLSPRRTLVLKSGKIVKPVVAKKTIKPMALTPLTIRDKILSSLKKTYPLNLKSVPKPTKDFVIPRDRPEVVNKFVATTKPIDLRTMSASRAAANIVGNTYGNKYTMDQLVGVLKQVDALSERGAGQVRISTITPESTGVVKNNKAWNDQSRMYLTNVPSGTTKKESDQLMRWAASDSNPVRNREYVKGSYQCLQFATDFVNASRKAGFDTYLVSLNGTHNDGHGKAYGHAMVGLKMGDYVYTFDPSKGASNMSDPRNWLASKSMTIDKSVLEKIPANQVLQEELSKAERRPATSADLANINTVDTIPMLSFFEPQYPNPEDMDLRQMQTWLEDLDMEVDLLAVYDNPKLAGLDRIETQTDDVLIDMDR